MICAVDNCGRACAPGETVCRKHGGDPLACGICGNVDCQGHQLIQVEKSLAELAGYPVEGPLGRLELRWRLQRGVSNPPSLRSV